MRRITAELCLAAGLIVILVLLSGAFREVSGRMEPAEVEKEIYTPEGDYYNYFEDTAIFGESGDFYSIVMSNDDLGWQIQMPRSQMELAYSEFQGGGADEYSHTVTEYEADGETETGWKVYAGSWTRYTVERYGDYLTEILALEDIIEVMKEQILDASGMIDFRILSSVYYEVNGWEVMRYYAVDTSGERHIIDCTLYLQYPIFVGASGTPVRYEGFSTEEVMDIMMEGLHVRR